MTTANLNPIDADRLKLLDRLADRVPELDLAEHEVEWMTLYSKSGRTGVELELVFGNDTGGCETHLYSRRLDSDREPIPASPARLGDSCRGHGGSRDPRTWRNRRQGPTTERRGR